MGGPPVILLTHGDLDGAACAVVFLCLFVDEIVRVEYHDYKTIDGAVWDALNSDDEVVVWLADISPSAETLERLQTEAPHRVTILDHHRNSRWAEIAESCETIGGRFEDGKCGARIALETIGGQGDLLERFVDVVETRDLWQNASPLWPDSERLQALFVFLGMERFVERCCTLYNKEHHDPGQLYGQENQIVDVLAEKSERYISSRVKLHRTATDENGDRFAWTVATREGSKIGQALASMDGARYGAVWNPERNVIELRSVDDFNVGALAKTRGGGGHDRAAGHPLPPQMFPRET